MALIASPWPRWESARGLFRIVVPEDVGEIVEDVEPVELKVAKESELKSMAYADFRVSGFSMSR